MQPVFITGIGTDVGKTVMAAIVAEALQADYWKPVQAGYAEGTDSEWVNNMISGSVYPETYKLKKAASPHIAAREEGIEINMERIAADFAKISPEKRVVTEGAGGLLVPLNDQELVVDLIKKLNARVVLVSRNYLGSINHSLLTAQVCRQHGLDVAGWIFNDSYLNYENEIAAWSGYPVLGNVLWQENIDKQFIQDQVEKIRPSLLKFLK